MEVVKIELKDFKISMEYLTDLAGEFYGNLLQATPGERALEYGFEGPDEKKHAKGFYDAVNGSFRIKQT